MDLWKTLRPGDKLKERMTTDWVKIGFQGKDPATDFRGGGILALDQLHKNVCLSEKKTKKKLLKIYKDSQREECWFFFAVTGINITGKLVTNLQSEVDKVLFSETLLKHRQDLKIQLGDEYMD